MPRLSQVILFSSAFSAVDASRHYTLLPATGNAVLPTAPIRHDYPGVLPLLSAGFLLFGGFYASISFASSPILRVPTRKEKDDPYDLPHVPKHSPSSLLTLSILLKSGSDGIQNLFSLLPRLPSSNINRTVHKGFPGSFFHDWFSFQSLPSPAVVQQPIPQCFAPRNHTAFYSSAFDLARLLAFLLGGFLYIFLYREVLSGNTSRRPLFPVLSQKDLADCHRSDPF